MAVRNSAMLRLSANLLESLARFPRSEIPAYLDVPKNHLKTVSDLPALPHLTTPNPANDWIAEAQLPALPCLHVLSLSGNPISTLELLSLRTLDAFHDSIEENRLPFVSFCDLAHNQIATHIPREADDDLASHERQRCPRESPGLVPCHRANSHQPA
jgi:hypothetical protein